MPKTYSSLITITAAVTLGVVTGVGLWYVLLERKKNSIQAVDGGRGLGTAIPTFGGGLGSINANISETFERLVATEGTVEKSAETTFSAPRLWQLSTVPSAGMYIQTHSSTTQIFFTERVSGNIFSVNTKTGDITRLSNTLIPYVYESMWVNEKTILLRSIGEQGVVSTFLGTLQSSTSSPVSELVGSYLEPGIEALVSSPETDSYFILTKTAAGYGGIITSLKSAATKRIWDTTLRGWRFSWSDPSRIVAIQKSSHGVTGSVYDIDTKTGTVSPVVDGVLGLSVAVHPLEDFAIFSESFGESFTTKLLYNGSVTITPFKTLGEKCVWAPKTYIYCAVPREEVEGTLPDSWYRGETHTSDDWYQLNPETGEALLLVSPENDFGVSVDVLNPSINSTGEYIIFTDAVSGTPWVLRIEQ